MAHFILQYNNNKNNKINSSHKTQNMTWIFVHHLYNLKIFLSVVKDFNVTRSS